MATTRASRPAVSAPVGVPSKADRPFAVRRSRIQGRGAFATRDIAKGERLVEYTGERISREEGDLRYDDDAQDRPHTFLFTLDDDTAIDGAVRGNDSRYINHSCGPNCESVIEDGHIYIEAIKNIAEGTELTYDYHLVRPGRFKAEWRTRYACRCGSPRCRGMLLELPPAQKKSAKKGAAKKSAKSGAKGAKGAKKAGAKKATAKQGAAKKGTGKSAPKRAAKSGAKTTVAKRGAKQAVAKQAAAKSRPTGGSPTKGSTKGSTKRATR